MRGTFARILLLITFAALAGCASMTNNHKHAVYGLTATDPQGKGLGRVTISFRTNLVPLMYYRALILDKLDGKGEVIDTVAIHTDYIPAEFSTSLFSAFLPEGTYRIAELRTSFDFDYYDRLTGGALPNFRVEAGKHSDLGQALLSPNVGNGIYVNRSYVHTDNSELLGRAGSNYSKVEAQLAKLENPWAIDITPTEKQLEHAAKQLHATINTMQADHNGTIVTGGQLGQITIGSLEGPWLHIPLDTLSAIQAVSMSSGGKVYAVGEYVSIYEVNEKGQSRKISTAGFPDGRMVFAKHAEKFGLVVGVQTESAFELFQTDSTDDVDWKRVLAVPISNTGSSFYGNLVSFNSWATHSFLGDKVFVYVPHDILFEFDFSTGKTRQSKFPGMVYDFQALGGDGFAVRTTGGMGVRGYTSINFGDSWERASVLDEMAILTDGQGKLFRQKDGFPALVQVSTDYGATWSDHLPGKKGDLRVVGNHLLVLRLDPAKATSELYLYDEKKQEWLLKSRSSPR